MRKKNETVTIYTKKSTQHVQTIEVQSQSHILNCGAVVKLLCIFILGVSNHHHLKSVLLVVLFWFSIFIILRMPMLVFYFRHSHINFYDDMFIVQRRYLRHYQCSMWQ